MGGGLGGGRGPRKEGSLRERGFETGFLGETGRLLLAQGVLSQAGTSAGGASWTDFPVPCQGLEPRQIRCYLFSRMPC